MQLLLISLWILFSMKIMKDSFLRMDPYLSKNIFFEAFSFYNPLLMLAMMLWLWGINVYVFLRSRVGLSYAKVFEFDNNNYLTHREIWKIASWVTLMVVTSLTSYLYFVSHDEFQLAASQPVILYCLLPLLLGMPLDVFYMPSRFFFLETLVRLLFPLQPISFADFFVADVLTSMCKVLSDLERSVCKMYYHQVTGVPEDDMNLVCGNNSYSIPCILALPYLCRFFQCLRQYSDTRDKSCLFNALKYSTTFPVIILSAMKYHLTDLSMWESTYRPLWLLFSVINTCYSFYWDISRDWDFGLFSNSCKLRKPILRTTLLYNRRWVYYWAIGSNLVLRCSWTFKLSAHLRHNRLTVFTFSALEMLRRFQWIFFRVESECNKIANRSLNSQISLKELDGISDRESLLSASNHDV